MKRQLKMAALAALLFLSLYAGAQPANNEKAVYLDTEQPVEVRVKDLMSRMTLEEKAQFLNHRGPDIVRFGIKSDKWNQSLHGVWWNRPTTMFPTSIAMAATWDPKLIHEEATVISDEARAIYNWWHTDSASFQGERKGLIYRSPVINVSRNPYWGRINETYSEDPFLTGRLAVAHVKGLQGDNPKYYKLISTLKHYAVNNVEYGRQGLSATVSERMLHEYWLPHFKDAIVEGGAQSIMASYNAINGVPSNINKKLLTDILKTQWGFSGFVVSDLGGVRTMVTQHTQGQMTYEDAVAQSILAGCDFSDAEFMTYLPSAVKQGKLSEKDFNAAVARVMRGRFLLGEFDPFEMVPYSKIPHTVIGSPEHLAVALKAAQKSMVLLTNKQNSLPLDKSKIKSIAVIGPHADIFTPGGYSGLPMKVITPLEGIKNRMAPGTQVIFAKGAPLPPQSRNPNPPPPPTPEQRAQNYLDGNAISSLNLTTEQKAKILPVLAEQNKFLDRLNATIPENATDRQAQLQALQPKRLEIMQANEKKFVEILNADQQTAYTAIVKARNANAGFGQQGGGGGGQNANAAPFDVKAELAKAVDAAKQSDVAILYLGTTLAVEAEGRDRTSLGLAKEQEDLFNAVLAVNPRTIVVLINAGPLTIPHLKEKAPAIIEAWWNGEQGSNAIADVIFGNVNPGGKLPFTVYASESQVPPQDEYDITKGFTYMYLNGKPLFPFGHGLSYTNFSYSKLRIANKKVATNGKLTISVDIKNTGKVAGDEVVQLYVHDVVASVKRPTKELRGFERITLKPGETKTVTMTVPVEKLSFYDEKTHGFIVEPGMFDIMIGSSSEDIRLQDKIEVVR
jgi:beta-glucosidase